MTLAQETDYPESPTSTITVRNAKAVQFPLGVRIPGWPASFAQRERSAATRLLQRWKLGESRPKMKLRRQSFDRTPHGSSLRTRRPAASKTCCSGLRSNGSGKAAKASCRRFVAEILQTGAKAQV
jgi:Beta-L-arabinofuranosidase, GH127